MLMKLFVFSAIGLLLCLSSVRADETAAPSSTPHVSGAALTVEQKEKIKAERKARREAWIKSHPEQVKQMRENAAKRRQWAKEHPAEAKKMKKEIKARKAFHHRSKVKGEEKTAPDQPAQPAGQE